MSGQPHLRVCREDLAFFGKIGADVSHDMRNVLSIVGENAGLLDDQLALAESGKALDYEKLKKLSARITRQVTRGTQTMERFSLQRAVFSAIELILESLENGQVVAIKLAGRGATAVMSVSGSAAGAGELSGRISRLSAVINELEGSVETSWEDGVLSLTLTIPAK